MIISSVDPPLLARGFNTFVLLLAGAHQLHMLIRFMPQAYSAAALLFSLLRFAISYKRTDKDPRSSSTNTHYIHLMNFVIGLAVGAQHTLFVWSFLKLPPAVALAIYLLSFPLAKLVTGTYTRETLLSLFFLGLCLSNHSPLDPHSLTRAVGAVAIDVTVIYLKTRYDPTGLKGPIEVAGMTVSALLITYLASPRLFSEMIGKMHNPFRSYPIQLVIVVVSITVFGYAFTSVPEIEGRHSSIVPDAGAVILAAIVAGMRERISWDRHDCLRCPLRLPNLHTTWITNGYGY